MITPSLLSKLLPKLEELKKENGFEDISLIPLTVINPSSPTLIYCEAFVGTKTGRLPMILLIIDPISRVGTVNWLNDFEVI